MCSAKSSAMVSSRGAAPRLFCSPYFTIAALALLAFLSMRHWSLAAQNQDLIDRLARLQSHMKAESFNVKNLETTLSEKEVQLKQLKLDKESLQHNLEESNMQIKTGVDEFAELQKEKMRCVSDLSDIRAELHECGEERDRLSERIDKTGDEVKAEVEVKQIEIEDLKKKVNELQGEVASLKEKEVMHVQGGQGQEDHLPLREGELSPVDPREVHVRQKAEQGMTFHKDSKGHYLPLLPRGDPNKPRRKPEYSVNQRPKEDLFKKRRVQDDKNEPTEAKNPENEVKLDRDANKVDDKELEKTGLKQKEEVKMEEMVDEMTKEQNREKGNKEEIELGGIIRSQDDDEKNWDDEEENDAGEDEKDNEIVDQRYLDKAKENDNEQEYKELLREQDNEDEEDDEENQNLEDDQLLHPLKSP